MWRANSLEKTLMLGKIEGRKRRGKQRVRWLNGVTNLMDMSLSNLKEMMNDREVWRDAVHGVTKSQTGLHNWPTATKEIWFDKTSTSASLTMLKPLTVCITANCGQFLKKWEYQTTLPAFWKICMQVKKQQLELDMEQQTGSKLGKE